MTKRKRRLKDTLNDPKAGPVRLKRRKNRRLIRIALAMVIGVAGGFGLAKVIRIL